MLDNLLKEYLDKKKIFILMVAVGLIIVAMWLNYLLLPQVRSLIKILANAGSIRADLTAYRADINRIDIFRRKIKEYKDKIDYCESRFPVKGEIPFVVETVSDIARDSMVKITSITPLKPSEERTRKLGNFYQEIPILISIRSGYHELGTFINRVENSEKFMKIADIEIKANEHIPKRHDCELLILTYTKTEER